MITPRFIFPVLCLFFIGSQAASQETETRKRDSRDYVNRLYQTDFWDVDNSSLNQGTVQAITQSQDGFLWIATQGGLARFDGIKFEMFDTERSSEIRNDFLTDVEVTADSTVWCATFGGGIFSLKNGILRGLTTEHGLASGWMQNLTVTKQWGVWYRSSERIGQIADTTVVEDWGLAESQMRLYGEFHGSLWAGTSQGLLKFRGDSWEPVRFGSVRFGLAQDLFVDSTGSFWIASPDGLFSGTENDLKRHEQLRMSIRTVSRDRRGRVWVCTYDDGLYCLDGKLLTRYGRSDGLGSDNVRWTFEDSDGTIWVCDDAGGLSIVNNKGEFYPQVDEFLFGRAHVRTIFEDREGNLWVGTFAGLARVKHRRVRMITVENGLEAPMVWTLAETKNGDVYVGTNKGIVRYRNGRISSDPSLSRLPQVPITALFVDSDGVLWIGTLGEGLWSRHGQQVSRRFPGPGRTAPRIIRSVNEVGRDSLIIGAGVSTLLLNVRTPVATVVHDDTADGQLLATHRDWKGRLWIGMESGVIKEYRNDGTGVRLTLPVDAGKHSISWIVSDPDGTFWCTTLGAGIVRIRGGVARVFDSVRDGLPTGKYNWIVKDKGDELWIGTNKGVVRISTSSLEEGKVKMRPFGLSDGLLSTETLTWAQSTVILREDGMLWFGTLKGVGIIDVLNFGTNDLPPPVVISGLVVNGESHHTSEALVLPPGENNLEFHYTAPSLVAPERNQYLYRLEGHDPHWVEAGSRRVAFYTNVPPGTYRFVMRASNNDGVWSQRTASLTITLEPHFYQTLWFFGLCIMAIFGLGVGAQKLLWRYRNEKDLAERLQVRLEAAQLRALRMQLHPHFLFNTLNGIMVLIKKNPQGARTMVSHLSDLLRLTLDHHENQEVPLREELEILNKYLEIERTRFRDRLSVDIQVEKQVLDAMVPTFILQPLVENSIKHVVSKIPGPASISISACSENGTLKLTVKDTGPGIAPGNRATLTDGIGLKNTKARLVQMYGSNAGLELKNGTKSGLDVVIVLPLNVRRNGKRRG